MTPLPPSQQSSEPKTHDYTRRGRGHDYVIRKVVDDGRELRVSGWGYGISEGDYIIMPNGEDTTRYRFEKVEHCRDPKDMWHATLAFSPRTVALTGIEPRP